MRSYKLTRPQFRRELSRLVELYNSAYHHLPQYSLHENAEIASYLTWLHDQGSHFLVVRPVPNDPIIALAIVHTDWHLWQVQPRAVAELHELLVEPAWQGHGIGTGLLKLAMDMASKAGREIFELWVGEENRRPMLLYERFGFHRAGQWRHWVRMERELSPLTPGV